MNVKICSGALAMILLAAAMTGCKGGNDGASSLTISADSSGLASSQESTADYTSSAESTGQAQSSVFADSSAAVGSKAQSAANNSSRTESSGSAVSSKPFVQQEEKNLNIQITKTGRLVSAKDTYAGLPVSIAPEMVPVVEKIGGKLYEFISTSKSGAFIQKTGLGMFDQDHLDLNTGVMLTYPNYTDEKGKYLMPSKVSNDKYWRRNYFGTFDSFVRGGTFYSINHCENKNEIIDGIRYDNTVKPKQSYSTSDYSRMENGRYVDAAHNYFAFVTLSTCKTADLTKTGALMKDDTPIIWPVNGYLNFLEEQAEDGIRHPSVYVEGDTVYLYYLENSTDIMLARAKIDGSGKVGAFMKYYNGGFTSKGMPEGFRPNDPSFLSAHSDPATPIFQNNGAYRFFVRKLKGTSYYLGVQHGVKNSDQWAVYLRVSKDLIHWSEPVPVPGTEADGWGEISLVYPRLYAADLVNSMEIDPNQFIIAGTHTDRGHSVPQMLSLSIKVSQK